MAALSPQQMVLQVRTGPPGVPIVGGFQGYAMPDLIGVTRTDPRCADLGVTILGEQILDVLVGDVVTLTVQIDNPGPTEVQGRLLVTVDPHLTLIGGIGPGGDCGPSGTDWGCELGTLDVGGQALVELSVVADTFGVVSMVNVLATTTDIELAGDNNAAFVEVIASSHGGPCGAVTYQGECVDSLLRFCEDRGEPSEVLYEVDCATVFPGVVGVCTEIDPVYGNDCAVPVGESCFYVDDLGNAVFALCEGTTSGCVLDDATQMATCQDVGYSCAPPVGEDFVPTCIGDTVVVDCQARQPVAFDCASLGGACVGAACVSLPEGSPCDAELQCDSSLICHAPSGACVEPSDLCDPSTHIPTCAGTVVTYCSPDVNVMQELDCGALFTGGGGTCGTPFTCLDSGDDSCATIGVGCHGDGEGAPCDLVAGILCGVGLGCLLEADPTSDGHHYRCRDIGTCAFGAEHTGCVGDIATSCYGSTVVTAAEAAGVDCAAFGSSCVLDTSTGFPRCLAPLGGDCDVSTPEGALFGCAPGLICSRDPVSGASTCQPAPDAGVLPDAAQPDSALPDGARPDAGVASDAGVEPDAGPRPDAGSEEEEEEEDPGCGCGGCAASAGSEQSAPSVPVLLALVALALVWRRRR